MSIVFSSLSEPAEHDLFHGAFPSLEGEHRKGVKDANGKLFVVDFENVVQSRGSGWVSYMFPKPW